MIRRLLRLGRDHRGTSVVELGLVAPVLFTLMIGMVDVARGYTFKLGLEQAAQRSIEKVMQYQANTSTYATLYTEAAEAAGVPVDAVVVDFWLECNDTRQANYQTNCTAGQKYARYISVAVQKDFKPLFGTRFFPGANANGTIPVSGKAGIRTQ